MVNPHQLTAHINEHLRTNELVDYLRWLAVAKGQRPRTVQARARQLHRFDVFQQAHGRTVLEATHHDILAWLPDVGPDARRTYTAALSGFYAYLMLEGIRVDNPANRVPRPLPRRRLPKPISDEDAHHIWVACPEYARIPLGLALMCGMRCQELSAARWEDIEWGHQPVLLIGGEGAKGGHERRVVIPDALALVLRQRRLKHGWMARGPFGQGFNPESMSQWLAHVLRDELGVDASAHQCRHWYATTLLRHGANVRVVQDALGHASLATTGLYLKVTVSDQAVYAATLRP